MASMQQFDLDLYQNNSEIVLLTARQIMKDFAMFGMEISFTGQTGFAYQQLMQQVGTHLEQLLQADPQRLFALMYQIDISQQSVDAAISRSGQPHFALADLVIRREMMKVLTVQYFKNQKNKP